MNTRHSDTDGKEFRERLIKARSEGRRRTIMYSIVASGIVSLFIGHLWERNSYNDQAERSRKNCELVNEDRRLAYEQLDSQSDNVLGDLGEMDGDPDEDVERFEFSGTAFEKFQPLIIVQAQANRERSRLYLERIIDCDEFFPKRAYVPVID